MVFVVVLLDVRIVCSLFCETLGDTTENSRKIMLFMSFFFSVAGITSGCTMNGSNLIKQLQQ